MAWTLEFAPAAEDDFSRIFDHLARSYVGFGEDPADALKHAAHRVRQLRRDADRILIAPHRGQTQDDLFEGCRRLSFGQASFWFVVNDSTATVTILAILFGGQDARRSMLLRALRQDPS